MVKRYHSCPCTNNKATTSYTLNSLINMSCLFNPQVNRKVKMTKACGVMGSYVIHTETISWPGALTSWSLHCMSGSENKTKKVNAWVPKMPHYPFIYVLHSSNLTNNNIQKPQLGLHQDPIIIFFTTLRLFI